MSTQPELSVIVACRNEEAGIAHCIREIFSIVPVSCEVLIVDGGVDRTERIVRQITASEPRLRYIRNVDDRGKGHAIRVGIKAAKAEVQAQLDADLQFPPDNLPNLLEPIRKREADIVLGSRFMTGSRRLPASTPLIRSLGNRMVSRLASFTAGQRLTDVMAGAKAWTKEAIRQLDLTSDSYSYEAEIPLKAIRCGLSVVDVPVRTEPRRTGDSNVKVLRVAPRLIYDIVAFGSGWR